MVRAPAALERSLTTSPETRLDEIVAQALALEGEAVGSGLRG
jgi:hypothetical protein